MPGWLAFEGFQVFLPAFLIGHILHRVPSQDVTQLIFQQPKESSACSTPSPAKIVLNITDTAALVTRGDLNSRAAAGRGSPLGIPTDMGICQVVITAPPHPFQAGGTAPNQTIAGRPMGPVRVGSIDDFDFQQPWDPNKITPSVDRNVVGFRV